MPGTANSSQELGVKNPSIVGFLVYLAVVAALAMEVATGRTSDAVFGVLDVGPPRGLKTWSWLSLVGCLVAPVVSWFTLFRVHVPPPQNVVDGDRRITIEGTIVGVDKSIEDPFFPNEACVAWCLWEHHADLSRQPRFGHSSRFKVELANGKTIRVKLAVPRWHTLRTRARGRGDLGRVRKSANDYLRPIRASYPRHVRDAGDIVGWPFSAVFRVGDVVLISGYFVPEIYPWERFGRERPKSLDDSYDVFRLCDIEASETSERRGWEEDFRRRTERRREADVVVMPGPYARHRHLLGAVWRSCWGLAVGIGAAWAGLLGTVIFTLFAL